MNIKSQILALLETIQDQETLNEIHDWLNAFLEADTKETFESGEIQAVQEALPSHIQHNKDWNNNFHEKYCLHLFKLPFYISRFT